MAGIYIHIPFCKQACYYCDFHFSTNQTIKASLVNCIARELDLQRDYLEGEIINTVYFGGGTPSLLSKQELEVIFEALHRNHSIPEHAEITFEANPDDLSKDKLQLIKDAGINRLSIGIQSFDDNILKFLNRAHSQQSAVQCVNDAKQIGFENISLDLIYAIPGQDDEAWKKNIHQALSLDPVHISSYSLTIEPKTTFGRWSTHGKFQLIDDDTSAGQLEILIHELEKAGFDQYEVSNFGKPGYYSKHNSSYWKQEKYLGLGPSAHSFNGISRQFNVANNHLYLKAIEKNEILAQAEVLTLEDKVNDYLLTTLRTSWGCDLKWLKKHHDFDLLQSNSVYIDSLKQNGLATVQNEILILTKAGKFLADKIASDLFLVKQ